MPTATAAAAMNISSKLPFIQSPDIYWVPGSVPYADRKMETGPLPLERETDQESTLSCVSSGCCCQMLL